MLNLPNIPKVKQIMIKAQAINPGLDSIPAVMNPMADTMKVETPRPIIKQGKISKYSETASKVMYRNSKSLVL